MTQVGKLLSHHDGKMWTHQANGARKTSGKNVESSARRRWSWGDSNMSYESKSDKDGGESADAQFNNGRLGVNSSGYSVWRGVNTNKQVLIHRLVAVARHGFDEVAGCEIHHKDGIRWLNSPENLTPLDTSEHAIEHRVPDEEYIAEMQAATEALGRPPKTAEMDAYGDFSSAAFQQRFGSWEAAKQAAGVLDGDGA